MDFGGDRYEPDMGLQYYSDPPNLLSNNCTSNECAWVDREWVRALME